MIIFIARALSLVLALLGGMLAWGLVALLFEFVLEIGWTFWEFPFENIYRSYSRDTWLIVGYAVSILSLLLIPGLHAAYLNFLFGYRRPSKREQEIINQIEEELAWRCRSRNIHLPKIKWKVATQNYVNGFAYGRNYICLTQNLLRKARKSGPKWHGATVGVAAHELGHLYYYDGVVAMWLSILLWPLNFLVKFSYYMSFVQIAFMPIRFVIVPVGFVFTVLNWVAGLMYSIINLPDAMTSIKREYRADRFAHVLGLGRERVFQLEHSLSTEHHNLTGWQLLVHTHPPNEYRIQAYETWMQEDKNKPVEI